MAFGRLHEEAAGDGKLLALSDAAFRMWACGLIYCQKNLTDGYIPEHAIAAFGVRGFDGGKFHDTYIETFAGLSTRAKVELGARLRRLNTSADDIADELCRAQLPGRAPVWERVAGGYRVHDYLDWNDSRAEILKMRAQSRERMRRRRGEQPREQIGEHGAEHPTEHPTEHTGEPVVRGSSSTDLQESGSSNSTDGRPERRLNAGAAGPGASPRDHLRHAYCDPSYSRCVPAAVHDKLANMLAPKYAGDRVASAAALLQWYPVALSALPDNEPIGDEFKFWQRQFDAAFVTVGAGPAVAGRVAQPAANVPGVAATAKYLD